MAAYLLPHDLVAKRNTSKVGSDAHASIAESTAGVSSTSTSKNLIYGKQECIFVGIRLMCLRSFQNPKSLSWSNGDIPITAKKDLPLRGKG